MNWVEQFDLFLFDFDGLLVDTESLHHQAYIKALAGRGYHLDWSFSEFCSFAHLHATALQEALYAKWPHLDPDWDSFYAEKKKAYLDLLLHGHVQLMPGVAALLSALASKNIRRCVVTHSPQAQIDQIRSRLPPLQTIPHWITRHHYQHPKPHSECYLKAIELYSHPNDRIVGFEDSIRGWQALKQTSAESWLICSSHHPLLPQALAQGARHAESFESFSL
jgi:beta-phosphoglucomutase